MSARTVSCPQCGKRVEWSDTNTHRPFCSERCRLLDLGAWASERYRVATAPEAGSDDEPPSAPTDPKEPS
jgi:endogenous inhibitor of DNA gyrase (YacG/DUF329 family)